MQNIESFIDGVNGEFKEIMGGSFVKLSTAEIFTQAEVLKYVQRKLEIHNADILNGNNTAIREVFGLEPTQRITNRNSKVPIKKSSNKAKYLKNEKSEFNIVHRERIEEVKNMELNKNEKLVYYILRDFVSHPTNCIMINDSIPTFKDLEPLISLTERSIRDSLKSLEEKNLLKLQQSGHRKAIYINPEYYATGKELSIDTLKMFRLVEVDDEKIDFYLDEN